MTTASIVKGTFILAFLIVVPLQISGEACPDLQALDITLFGPQTVRAGESISSRTMIFMQNDENAAIGTFSVGIYLSTDAQITVDDQLLVSGREFISEFAPFGLDAIAGFDGLSIPGGYPAGAAYLGVIIDEYDAIPECSENNNTAEILINVSAAATSVRLVPGQYGTIAAAIAAANSGDTINISAGEYNEVLTVDRDLVIQGAGWDQTILKTNSSPTAIMAITSADVVIENIQFWSTFGEYFVGTAVLANNSSLLVRDSKFMQINQFNIELYDGSLCVDNIEMTRTIGVADIGVRVFDATFCFRNSYGGSRIDHVFDVRETSLGLIENNIIDGSTVYWSQGVRMMNDAIAVIRDNLMIGQHDLTTQTTHQPAGITLHDTAFANIYNNEIHGFVNGMYFSTNSRGKVHHNIVTDNIRLGIRANHDWFDYDGATPDLGGGAFTSAGQNVIKNNGDYNVQNNSASTVFAKYNDWGLINTSAIDNSLYDDNEDPALGEVIFYSFGFFAPVGDWVEIYMGPDFTIVFEKILEAGFVSLDIGPAGPRLPGETRVLPSAEPLYYDITTGAVYTGVIDIGLEYDDSDLLGSESRVRLYHYEQDQWQDVTTGIDPFTNEVFCRVNSLSPFIIVEAEGCCINIRGNANDDAEDKANVSDVSFLVAWLFGIPSGPTPPCIEEANANGDLEEKANVSDVSYLVAWLFGIPGGAAPPSCP